MESYGRFLRCAEKTKNYLRSATLPKVEDLDFEGDLYKITHHIRIVTIEETYSRVGEIE